MRYFSFEIVIEKEPEDEVHFAHSPTVPPHNSLPYQESQPWIESNWKISHRLLLRDSIR